MAKKREKNIYVCILLKQDYKFNSRQCGFKSKFIKNNLDIFQRDQREKKLTRQR